jgi:hypothetical protein
MPDDISYQKTHALKLARSLQVVRRCLLEHGSGYLASPRTQNAPGRRINEPHAPPPLHSVIGLSIGSGQRPGTAMSLL